MNLKIIFVFIFSSTFLMAQSTISGKVTDEFGNPILGAMVSILGTKINAETNLEGFFKLRT